MSERKIRFCQRKERVTYQDPTLWLATNEHGKFRWLQRIAEKILRRWGRVQPLAVTEYSYEPKSILDSVLAEARDQINALIRDGHEPLIIFASPQALFESQRDMPPFGFYDHLRTAVRTGNGPLNYATKMLGLKVIVNPYMTGVLVVPEVEVFAFDEPKR